MRSEHLEMCASNSTSPRQIHSLSPVDFENNDKNRSRDDELLEEGELLPSEACSGNSPLEEKRPEILALKSLLRRFHVPFQDPKRLSGVSPISNYKSIKKIGEGSSGEVKVAISKVTGKRVALKSIMTHRDMYGVPITALREINIIKSLNHENIINLEEIALVEGSREKFSPGMMYMVFPYMEHDLAGLLSNPDINLTPAHIKCFAKQLLEGVAYLHARDILHRDLKSANVLVKSNGVLKIADFGLARYYDPIKDRCELTPTIITVWYRPPELLLGSKTYTSAVDIWGVGCIFAELWDRKAIFAGNEEMEVLSKIFDLCGIPTHAEWGEFYSLAKKLGIDAGPCPTRIYERFRHTLDPTTIKFIWHMFTYDPSKRPTAIQALNHEYFYVDPPPAVRDSRDFPVWPDSHELGMRIVDRGDPDAWRQNTRHGLPLKRLRVHKDVVTDSRGKIVPRERIDTRSNSRSSYTSSSASSTISSPTPTSPRSRNYHKYRPDSYREKARLKPANYSTQRTSTGNHLMDSPRNDASHEPSSQKLKSASVTEKKKPINNGEEEEIESGEIMSSEAEMDS